VGKNFRAIDRPHPSLAQLAKTRAGNAPQPRK
jgi:hypothetical protein